MNKHTRIELARQGIITDEVRQVAADEGIDPEQLSKDIAEGLTVISRNMNHDIKPLGIGRGLRTKINANIGTSKDRISLDEEMEKLDVLIKYGADAVMDLSTGGPIKDIRRLAFAFLALSGQDVEAARFATEKEAAIMLKLMKQAPKTTSFGRVLDALSCYLGICQRMTYDGEPAMKLERYLAQGEPAYEFETAVERHNDRKVVRTLPLFEQLAGYQIQTEREKADVAYSFVNALVTELVELAAETCDNTGIPAIGITGGVSYDVPIVRMAETLVNEKGIPNGDGGISIGQNAIVGHLRNGDKGKDT